MTILSKRPGAGVTLFAAAVALAACREITFPNENAANVELLTQSPTARVVNGAVLGLLVGVRNTTSAQAITLGILGRENVILNISNPGSLTNWVAQPLSQIQDQGDAGWTAAYAQVRNGFTILDLVDRVPNYSAAEKEGVRGVTKTFIAMAYIDQLRVRDTFGIVLDIDVHGSAQFPFVSRDSAYTRAAQMLDEAKTHLAAAGAAFPFTLTSGFTGFTTPATFLKFNRATKARLELYRGRWTDVLGALSESFISTPATGAAAALALGVFNVYPSGEANNNLSPAATNPTGIASFLVDAQRRADGTPDLRASSKAQIVASSAVVAGVSSNVRITVYPSQNANVPIIRNEELILMRAEANLALGDRAAAITDLNYIRVNSGGLAPLPANYSGDLVTEVLYNRRYSLFFEYGHRWVDMRRYGRLNQLEKLLPSHRIFALVPLPQQECLARLNAPKGCVTVAGF